jgi:hypothetical protein
MRRVASLCGLLAALILVLTWELMAPERGADDPRSLEASPVAPSAAVATGSGEAPPPAFDADALADVAVAIIARPLFSPGRRPSGGPSAAVTTTPGGAEHALPRLTGTIVGPAGGRAIFAGADGKSHTAAEGDAVGAFKVRTIDPGAVTLSGSEGDRVLRPTYVTSPGANVTAPGVNVTGPGASVTAPDASVTSPGANVTVPAATVGVRPRGGAR